MKKKAEMRVIIIETLKNIFSDVQFVCTWVKQLLGHVFQAVDLFLLRSVNYHGGGTQYAKQAAELPVQV